MQPANPIVQPSDADIAERLTHILASEEFQPQASDRFLRWLTEFDTQLGAWLSSLRGPGLLLGLCFVALAVAVLIWALRTWVVAPKLQGNRAAAGSAALPLEASPASLLARARALADAGSLREAARALQAAALRAACDERELEWRPALSDGEWLSLLGSARELAGLTQATERLAFGPAPTRAAFDACERRASRVVAGASGGAG